MTVAGMRALTVTAVHSCALPISGQGFSTTVATFMDTGGPENPNDTGDYNATINWGDNTTSTGTISLSGTTFTVAGSHTYGSSGKIGRASCRENEDVSATVADREK